MVQPGIWCALLSGEHPTLPEAELRSLLDVHAPQARLEAAGRIAYIRTSQKIHRQAHAPGKNDAHDDAHGTANDDTQPKDDGDGVGNHDTGVLVALRRAALIHEAGPFLAGDCDDEGGLARIAQVLAGTPGTGSVAVTTTRYGRQKGVRALDVERALGKALQAAGHTVDLVAPQRTVAAWLGEGQIIVVERRVDAARGAFQSRLADTREHFSPITLHPRRAASLIHLLRVAPGGRIYDPFCGTGSFVLEAALEGYDAWGSDLDAWMVQGTWQTLTDAGPEPLDATIFEADIGDAPECAGIVDGVIADLPYGRASSTHDEGLAKLYDRALVAFAQMLAPGSYALVGHGEPAALGDPARHGFATEARFEERAHKSLTRHFALLRRC